MKKFLSLLLVVVLTASLAVGGTLAYLTDRDSKANVFTVGDVSIVLNEKFDQGATLIPGVKIEKVPTITNTGKNDAWVWMTYAIPSGLNGFGDASKNIIHVNHAGNTWYGYENNNSYWAPDQTEAMPADQLWKVEEYKDKEAYTDAKGVKYDVYTSLYMSPLKIGDTTSVSMKQVYLDPHVDIDPEGNWAWIENGNVTPIAWNSNTNGNPVIYVSAYAVQVEGFVTVDDAYKAYQAQWGTKGGEYADPAMIVTDAADLGDALATESNVFLKEDVTKEGEGFDVPANQNVTVDLNDKTLGADYLENNGELVVNDGDLKTGTPAHYGMIGNGADSVTVLNDVDVASGGGGVAAANGAQLTINGGSVDVSSASTSGRYNIYAEGAGTVVTVNGGKYSFSAALNQKRAYICALEGAVVYVNGGEFGKASTRSDYSAGIRVDASSSVVIKGGAFGFDPTNWVADGYEATEVDGVWTVSAK